MFLSVDGLYNTQKSYRGKGIINCGGTNICLRSTFVNTIVTALQSPEWEYLFQK